MKLPPLIGPQTPEKLAEIARDLMALTRQNTIMSRETLDRLGLIVLAMAKQWELEQQTHSRQLDELEDEIVKMRHVVEERLGR